MIHVHVHVARRVQNASGPCAPPLSPMDQFRHDLNPPPSSWNRFKSARGAVSSSALFGLTERISNVELYTNLYGGIHVCVYMYVVNTRVVMYMYMYVVNTRVVMYMYMYVVNTRVATL